MLFQLPLEIAVDVAAILVGDPAALDQDVGQRPVDRQGPDGAGLDELGLVDHVALEGEDGEEQVAVDGGLRHHRRHLWRRWVTWNPA